tara:strand:+ start:223 stop:978 length:756 start_codon:yes stop_codon:yes gene_type:complete
MLYSKKFKKFKKINHCFFTKKGGFSKGIYKSLNCGRGSMDKRKNIYKNLTLVSKKIKVKKNKLLLMHQTHSNKVKIINNKSKNLKKINSDSIVTNIKGIAVGVVTADCVPIILYDIRNEIIGCIHAGWKGSLNGIIENTINKFKKISPDNNIYACVGPCIGKKSYEVSLDFSKNFIAKSKKNAIYFTKKNKKKRLFDLRKYVTDKLTKLNVKIDHINRDTFRDKNNFFSYRRSQRLCEKDYGRCISVISLI